MITIDDSMFDSDLEMKLKMPTPGEAFHPSQVVAVDRTDNPSHKSGELL
jgi:hypothetical protein